MLAQAADGEGFVVADLDFARLAEVRACRCPRSPIAGPTPIAGRSRPRCCDDLEGPRHRPAAADPVSTRRSGSSRARGSTRAAWSDIAQEANVAYGLVYHYFSSKDQVLNELFVERWSLLLMAIEEADARDIPAREKLDAVAGFIIGSYRHESPS